MFIYVDRVESKSNISDEPSRLVTDGLMLALGAKQVEPNLQFLDSPVPSRNPEEWFGNIDSWKAEAQLLYEKLFPSHPP